MRNLDVKIPRQLCKRLQREYNRNAEKHGKTWNRFITELLEKGAAKHRRVRRAARRGMVQIPDLET